VLPAAASPSATPAAASALHLDHIAARTARSRPLTLALRI
jgi:hypothetical protein